MRLTVLTDLSGKILAARYRIPDELAGASRASSAFDPQEGQRVHEIQPTDEIAQCIISGTLADQLSRYRVQRKGKAAILVKSAR